jgi:hypothetical protein
MLNFQPLTRRIENGIKYWTFYPEDMWEFIAGYSDDEEFTILDEHGGVFTVKSVGQMKALLQP